MNGHGAIAAEASEYVDPGSTAPRRDLLEKCLVLILGVGLCGELFVLFSSMLARTLFGASWTWSQEIAELCLVTLTFIGSALAYRRGQHMALHILIDRLPRRLHERALALEDCAVLAVAVVSAVLAAPTLWSRWDEYSPVLQVRQTFFVAPLFVGMVLVGCFACERLLRQSRVAVAVAALVAIGVCICIYVPRAMDLPTETVALPFSLCVFLVMIIAGVPIGFVLIPSAQIYLLWSRTTAPLGAIQSMQSISENFILLAIPFYILTGFLMTAGGLSKPLSEFVASLIGHVRGGLLQAVIATMYLFSGISGSKVADVAAVGSTMVDALRRRGYQQGEIVSVLAASAVMGETVPPSIAMLVLGSVTTVSMAALFVAGVVPALVVGAFLMALVFFRARSQGMPKEPAASWSARRRATARALPALLVPVILAYGILGGVGTPTEVSSLAVVYALVVAVSFYRTLGVTGMWEIVAQTASTAGMVLFIISAGGAFSWALTVADLPGKILEMLTYLNASPPAFMVLSVVILVLAGAVFEGLPALLIFGPLLLPVAAQLGIDTLQYSIVIILAMGLGAFLPPIGIGFYVTCAVCDVKMESAIRPMIPYVLILIIAILVVAFVPWFSTSLPSLVGLGS